MSSYPPVGGRKFESCPRYIARRSHLAKADIKEAVERLLSYFKGSLALGSYPPTGGRKFVRQPADAPTTLKQSKGLLSYFKELSPLGSEFVPVTYSSCHLYGNPSPNPTLDCKNNRNLARCFGLTYYIRLPSIKFTLGLRPT